MVTEKLLEEGRPSRNKAGIPVWGTIGLVLMLIGVSTFFLVEHVPAFRDITDLFVIDIHINADWGFTMTLTEIIVNQGWALFGFPGGLILLILLGVMKHRKGGYTVLLVFAILTLVAAILIVLYLAFLTYPLRGIVTDQVNGIIVLVLKIDLWVFYGFMALVGVLSWFDHLFHGKYAPIYERFKERAKKYSGEARSRYKRTFRKLWTKRRYPEMILMLYEDNEESGLNSPMDYATFTFVKNDIVNSYGKAKEEELKFLYYSGQYDALRDDRKAIDEALKNGKKEKAQKPKSKKVKVRDTRGREKEVDIVVADKDQPFDKATMRLIKKGERQAKKERRR